MPQECTPLRRSSTLETWRSLGQLGIYLETCRSLGQLGVYLETCRTLGKLGRFLPANLVLSHRPCLWREPKITGNPGNLSKIFLLHLFLERAPHKSEPSSVHRRRWPRPEPSHLLVGSTSEEQLQQRTCRCPGKKKLLSFGLFVFLWPI